MTGNTAMLAALGVITCLCAVVMAVVAAMRIHDSEHAGSHRARPFVLPVFVGIAYVALNSLVVYDAICHGKLRLVVQVLSQIIQTALIISVLLLLRCPRRGK